MRVRLSAVSNLMFLLHKSMACAVYLPELILYHIVCISNYKSIKSIDDNLYMKIIDAKSKQSYKLSARYTSEDKWVWRYCNDNDHRIKDGLILLLLKQREEL